MTPEQIEALTPALARYLEPFLFCCEFTQTFELLDIYCRGLLSDLKRKTAEPIALEAGIAVRTLQEFLRDHRWHFDQARDILQRHVVATLKQIPDDIGTIGLADETSTVKKGTKTPGVQRQYCGERGKIENCIVTVHLGVCRGHYKTLIDADLFLPEVWDEDRDRCDEAGIPPEVHYRPKWQIVLEEVDRSRSNGLILDWMTFDEGYGSKPGFLTGLEDRRQRYVGEVPKSFRCFTQRPWGRKIKGCRADNLMRFSPLLRRQNWRRMRLTRQTLGDQVWEVKAVRVWLSRKRQLRRQQYWLMVARNVNTGEVKYFVSNAPAKTRLVTLMRVAFCRWNVEHCFRVSKSELGFRHWEGRSYVGLMRHLTLCQMVLTFVADQTERLRGEKPGSDHGASVPGFEPAMRRVAGGVAGDARVGTQVGSHLLSPAA